MIITRYISYADNLGYILVTEDVGSYENAYNKKKGATSFGLQPHSLNHCLRTHGTREKALGSMYDVSEHATEQNMHEH